MTKIPNHDDFLPITLTASLFLISSFIQTIPPSFTR